MTQTPFEQFISLVEVDQKINGLNKSIKALEQENKANQKNDEANFSSLEKIKEKLHDMRKEVDSKELEMKTLDIQEAEKKKRLESISSHKDYSSIKAEIDQLKKAQHALEDSLMQVWNQLETAKKEFEMASQQYEQQKTKIQELIHAHNLKIAEVNTEIGLLTNERAEKEKSVPAEWLEKYAVMRARVTDPVVPVHDGNCSACFYKISAQDMQALAHRRLVQCKDCFRLLYLPEAQKKTIEDKG